MGKTRKAGNSGNSKILSEEMEKSFSYFFNLKSEIKNRFIDNIYECFNFPQFNLNNIFKK